MPQERLPMRKIREVLRLKAGGLSKRRIAASLGISATAAMECVQARRAGLTWPLPEDLSDDALEQRLYPRPTIEDERRPLPNWAEIHRELKRPGVTLQLLWQEYREEHVSGYAYSRFCCLHRACEKRVSPTMRQTHIAGERMFVDYAGTKLQVIDGITGETLTAELFVAVLGASSLTYAEATWRDCQKFCVRDFCEGGFRFVVSIEIEASEAWSASLLGCSKRSSPKAA